MQSMPRLSESERRQHKHGSLTTVPLSSVFEAGTLLLSSVAPYAASLTIASSVAPTARIAAYRHELGMSPMHMAGDEDEMDMPGMATSEAHQPHCRS